MPGRSDLVPMSPPMWRIWVEVWRRGQLPRQPDRVGVLSRRSLASAINVIGGSQQSAAGGDAMTNLGTMFAITPEETRCSDKVHAVPHRVPEGEVLPEVRSGFGTGQKIHHRFCMKVSSLHDCLQSAGRLLF